jgi:hypothetical protein
MLKGPNVAGVALNFSSGFTFTIWVDAEFHMVSSRPLSVQIADAESPSLGISLQFEVSVMGQQEIAIAFSAAARNAGPLRAPKRLPSYSAVPKLGITLFLEWKWSSRYEGAWQSIHETGDQDKG